MKNKLVTTSIDLKLAEKLEKDATDNYRTTASQVRMIIEQYYKVKRD